MWMIDVHGLKLIRKVLSSCGPDNWQTTRKGGSNSPHARLPRLNVAAASFSSQKKSLNSCDLKPRCIFGLVFPSLTMSLSAPTKRLASSSTCTSVINRQYISNVSRSPQHVTPPLPHPSFPTSLPYTATHFTRAHLGSEERDQVS